MTSVTRAIPLDLAKVAPYVRRLNLRAPTSIIADVRFGSVESGHANVGYRPKDSMASCQGFHETPGIEFGLVGID